MPNAVECLLQVYEVMVEVLLVLKYFSEKIRRFKYLLCGAPSCCEACLFFSDSLLRFRIQSVQYDLQHDFDWVTDEGDRSVVMTLLQIAFLGKCDCLTVEVF